MMTPTKEELLKELTFKTSRSGGAGGQNVNKVSSKVELIFNVQETLLFNDDEKALIVEKLKNKIDSEGNLHIVSQVDRSQLVNKEITITKFLDLLEKSLTIQKKRKPTRIPKAVIAKRLANKSVTAAKKQNRKPPNLLKGE
jgi:ribosome-associated protein